MVSAIDIWVDGRSAVSSAESGRRGKVVFLREFTPEDACTLMEKERAYGASLVPTLLIRLLNYSDLGKYDLSSLRFMLTATAPLPLPVALEAER